MSVAAEQGTDEVAELPVAGPGERLRAARSAAGLELDRVADRLHLRADQVTALERDDYDGFPARVFVRGYLRNYARLVDLPVDSILDSFDTLYPDPDAPLLKRVGSHRPQVSSRHGMVRLVTWVLVLSIIGLFGVWWSGYLADNGKVDSALVPGLEQPEVETPALPLAADDGVLSLPPKPLEPAAEATPPASQPAAVEDASPAPMTDTAPAEVPSMVDVPSVAEAPVVATPPAAAPEVVLSLSGACWVEIRATDGSFKLFGEYGAGTRRVLGGNPPYKVLLGNAGVASLTIDGVAVDLAPHIRRNVARLELDPAAR